LSRSIILGKLQRFLANQAQQTLPERLPEFPQFDDPVDSFRRELEAVGGVVLDGRHQDNIPALLSEVLRQAGTTEIFWESPEIFEKYPLTFRLRDTKAFETRQLVYSSHRRFDVQFPVVLHSKPYSRTLLESIELSASHAAYGVAETGTIVHQVSAPTGRLLSVMPPAHLAFLSPQRLLMNCRDLFDRPDLTRAGSTTTFVTGPSQTADIEKILVRGVHGPHQWFVILTD